MENFDINEFQKILGHHSSDKLENTTKIHYSKLNNEFKTCEQSYIAKSRPKDLYKDWKGESQVPGDQSYLDISSIKDLSYGGSNFWVLIVDNFTDYSWSIFPKNKSYWKYPLRSSQLVIRISIRDNED
jgi:hypothetical protein